MGRGPMKNSQGWQFFSIVIFRLDAKLIKPPRESDKFCFSKM